MRKKSKKDKKDLFPKVVYVSAGLSDDYLVADKDLERIDDGPVGIYELVQVGKVKRQVIFKEEDEKDGQEESKGLSRYY